MINVQYQSTSAVIGEGAPAFLIAEVSANHDQDLDQALELVKLAAEAGFSAIKLQTYSPESLTIRSVHPTFRVDPVWGARDLYELYSKTAMPMEFHRPIFDRSVELGLLPFTTLYDPRDLDFTEALGNCVYKIASFELVHIPLLKAVAQTKKPVILSTGMATLAEVEEALDVLASGGAGPIVLLHCCSSYPSEPDQVNLAAIDTMKRAFGLPVGFSDHTVGPHIPLAAVMLGACAIEKHITNDPNRSGPDHRFSAAPDVMRDMVRMIRDAEAARGDGRKIMRSSERVNRDVGRRSLYARADIAVGEAFTDRNVAVVRPGGGLHPRHYESILGKRARRAVVVGGPLSWDDIA
ncbi:pseudaminic acid synthase [Pseudorhodoplanes sp.]|uniref:pseudaminic acid synthase n=1 Tax=Pseudorhodoplanes sp. TaxID=1934341 RepID=UPI002D04C560|nr:pseudaminic acid synthase [Pseudorhodoplanes sp.]HWV54435.1 pseudaminic acid synthase [Pseudorhodoplanes sp.]